MSDLRSRERTREPLCAVWKSRAIRSDGHTLEVDGNIIDRYRCAGQRAGISAAENCAAYASASSSI
jgi:hypothetical protein